MKSFVSDKAKLSDKKIIIFLHMQVAFLVVALVASTAFAEEQVEAKKVEKRGLGYGGLGYGSGLYGGGIYGGAVAAPIYSGYSSVSVHPSYGYGSYGSYPYSTYSAYPAYKVFQEKYFNIFFQLKNFPWNFNYLNATHSSLYRAMVHILLHTMAVTTVATIALTIQVPMDLMAACCTKSFDFDKKIHFPTHCLSALFGLPWNLLNKPKKN